MNVAVPEWRGRVSPVFDVAEHLLLIEWNGDRETRRQAVSVGSTAPHDRARRLIELRVDVLVCGAVSWPLEALLVAGGVRVIPLVCGDVEEVLRAFLAGTLHEERFAMPGCCRARQNKRRRRQRGGGPFRL